MKLQLENVWTKVLESSELELAWLDHYLSFEDKSRFFMRRKYGRGDGLLHLFDHRRGAFPSGLAEKVDIAAAEEGYAVTLDNVRVDPCPPSGGPQSLASHIALRSPGLRDYQCIAVERALARTRGILHLPTGAGKTRIACALVQNATCHWLFLVHRQDLLRQTQRMYHEVTGNEAGHVGEGELCPDTNRRFTVATFQTLAAGLRAKDKRVEHLLADVEGLICDEAHVCAASTFWRVAMKTRRAFYRIGLSGTPLARGDRRGIYTVGALGPVIYHLKPEALIQQGVLARPTIRVRTLVQSCKASSWQAVYTALVERSSARNALVIEMTQRARKPALVFVSRVAHGHALARWLNASGIKAEFQWGASSSSSREAAIKRLRFGDIDVVVCSIIWQEGVDIPEVEAVINAAGGRSTIAAIQRIGRGMRTDEGRKGTFEVWEIYDKDGGFLERHSKERVRAYRKEGHAVQIT